MNTSSQLVKNNRNISYPDAHLGEIPIAHNRDTFYEQWQRHAPIVWADGIFGTGGWFAVTYETCRWIVDDKTGFSREVFRGHQSDVATRLFHNKKILGNNLYFHDEPTHARMKSLFDAVFEERTIFSACERVNGCWERILPELRRRGEFDLVHDVAWPLACAASEFIGIQPRDMWRFPAWEAERIGSRFLLPLPDSSLELVNANSVADQYAFMQRIVSDRRRHPRNDLITALVSKKDFKRDAYCELISNLFFFSSANFITLRDQLSSVMLTLLQEPEEAVALTTNLSLIPNAVEELWRLTAPDQFALRIAVSDLQVNGTLIKKGDLIIALLGAANRDPTVFYEPHYFWVMRPNLHQHLADSASSYACLSAPLFKAIVSTVLKQFVEEMASWRVQSISWSDALQDRSLRRAIVRI